MQAATIASATGTDKTRGKYTSRLGSVSSRAEANTWKTFATAFIKADGSGFIEVRRGNKTIHMEFADETNELPTRVIQTQEQLEISVREGFRQDILAGYIKGD